MRVTQGMLAQNSLSNLSKSYGSMDKLQNQLSTGKKISRPSDDPVVAMKGMFYRTNLTEVEQFKRNLSESYTWMDNSESGIEQGTQVFQRFRELTVQARNGSNSAEDLKAIGAEMEQLREDLIGVANTQVAGKYIFNGTSIDQPPVAADGTASFKTDSFNIEVIKGVSLKSNVNGVNAFGGKVNDKDLFQTMQDVINAVNTNTLGSNDPLANLDKHFNNMSAERSELGARYNRLELIDDRVAQQEVVANRILSDNEDADIEQVITDLKIQESVNRAALSVSARIIQPTLMDFLR
ncbi:flagellar hook-associated protein FlgL [Metabacillus sp. GX 13764]|uniref:flagellar hook-associated protein FlgL n=1 Tax=Metabacillus kandeliae TaxID=2900151 RepID=UPI001E41E3A8|nr:flagellar hook-associated protein FlgL [Metabacillus kandeliae]MCD7034448.1 flagellar hook-associated protein FlgL [Metabacillus kandeliae]